jgi:hypothetical protein
VTKELTVQEAPEPLAPARPRRRRLLIGLLVFGLVLILGATALWVYRTYLNEPPLPAKPVTPARVAPTAAAPGKAAAPTEQHSPAPTPSAAINAAAKVPINAVNQARAVTAAQGVRAGETDAIVASETPVPAPARRSPPATAPVVATTELAPGVTATAQLDAGPEASAEFRAFVAGLRISGVVGGRAPRAFINGRLVRGGETIDPGLRIIFEGVNDGRLVFKDGTGATIQRKF